MEFFDDLFIECLDCTTEDLDDFSLLSNDEEKNKLYELIINYKCEQAKKYFKLILNKY